jgi:hypothetical protein
MNDEGLPWRHGAVAGAVAWAIGFAVMCLLLAVLFGPVRALFDPLRTLFFATLFFLGAHLWILLTGGIGGEVGLLPIVFTPVPLMLLFAAGYRVATVADVRWSREAYLTGATVAVGYAAMTVVALVAIAGLTGTLSNVSTYIFIFGFTGGVVPFLAGGLGGVFAAR